MKIALNGRICEEREAVISVYDHGFLYGLGLFETFRTYSGRPFLLEEHLRRLSAGCEELGIRYVPDPGETSKLIGQLLSDNGLTDAYIRLSVSAGVEQLGLPAADYESPNVILYMKPLPLRDPLVYEHGKAVQRLALPRNSPEGTVRFKSFHYMNNILAKREMRSYPWATGAEGIFLDGRGYVAEGIVSNLFWIRQGAVFTPSLDTGILPGITREYVIGAAVRTGMAVNEGLYVWEEVMQADEAFLTNSVQELVPVCRGYDGSGREWTIGQGIPGPWTRKLMEEYRTAATRE
jgi:4-amino-4-deoxychorismate lyase